MILENKKILIEVVNVSLEDSETGDKILESTRAIETDREGKRYVRVCGEIVYLEEDENE